MSQPNNRANLHLLSLAGMLTTLSQLIFIPSIILIRDELQASNLEISLTVAGFTIAQAIAQLIYGPVVDRYPAKNVLLLGLSVFSVSSFAIFFAQTIEWVIVLRIIQGLSISAASICGSALITDMYEEKGRDKALTVFQMYFSMGAAAGPAIGAVMRIFLDWRFVFLFLAIWSVTVTVFLYKNLNVADNVKIQSFSFKKAVHTIKNAKFIMICIAGAGASFIILSYHTNIGFLLADFFEINANWTGFVFMAIPLGVFTGTNISRWLLSHVSREWLLFIGLVGVVVTAMLFNIPLYFFELTTSIVLLVTLLYLSGVSLGMVFPMVAAIVVNWFAPIRGTALSVVFFTRDIGSTLGPILTGIALTAGGVPFVFAVVAAVAIGGLVAGYVGLFGSKETERNNEYMEKKQGVN
ncbi:MFS transporter [Halalkalibacter kiskunsagensis]|uniref:MFS transporter n=1 Tax=Halalkalibacter kiskunsagensis TaxID=1548599 RepID=A0ABV6K918_9BACI